MANDEGAERADRVASRREERKTRRSRSRGRESQTDNTDDREDTSGTDDTSRSSDTSAQSADNTSETEQTNLADDSDGTTVREQRHVAMYLGEDLADDLDLRFDELNLEYRRKYGEKMTKNGEFYPAVARATINNTTIREELGLERDE